MQINQHLLGEKKKILTVKFELPTVDLWGSQFFNTLKNTHWVVSSSMWVKFLRGDVGGTSSIRNDEVASLIGLCFVKEQYLSINFA